MTTMAISAIKIGERHRKDLGDIAAFAANIAEYRLLQPIVVRSDGTLIDGGRRIAAFKLLGWTEIPAHIVDIDAVVRGEFVANTCRKNFTPSELVAISKAVEERERELAQQRMTLGKISTGSTGKTRDKVAAPFGTSGRTFDKMCDVVAAAEAEPEKFGRLKEDMDRTGKVNGPYRRLRNMQAAEAIRTSPPPPLPGHGPYHGKMVDFPWAYELHGIHGVHRGVLPFVTMSIDEVCAFTRDHIAPRTHHDCVAAVWVTNYIVLQCLAGPLLEPLWQAWGGLKPVQFVTWPKDDSGQGHWAKGQTEHLVIAARGKPLITLTNQSTLLQRPPDGFHLVCRGAHSSKPIEAYAWFESLYPAERYADWFSRYRHNERWDPHGDQAPLVEAAE
jgi:N6-adenosine-specific RNA methylase IME4